ncbi:hypothetical protein [Bacillus sp. FJAT-50079]|uniref:hypothetical protein n=1 Tax=Bacillus sp. FJAT-50079 TaxID=2833577 RepID=UPI001BC91EB3|nr:hypothetical protein [Bacillus sp. FJAT-50079]MBS4206773.1 hypothetical protein [Bacillus sp. FJAT-50079]
MEQVFDFLRLWKERNERFIQEQAEIRIDFLVRGICEKEVDGLLEDALLYPNSWLPSHLRWESLCQADEERLGELVAEGISFFTGVTDYHFDLPAVKTFIGQLNEVRK